MPKRAGRARPPRRRAGLRLPKEMRHLAPLLLRRERIAALVATLIDLLDALEDTDADACAAEDLPPPGPHGAPGEPDDAEDEG